jgi:transposase
MPRCYGSPIPCWRRLRKWQEEGVWEGIWRVLLASLDEQGRLAWQLAFLDGTFVAAKKGRSCGAGQAWPGQQGDGAGGWSEIAVGDYGGQWSGGKGASGGSYGGDGSDIAAAPAPV